ncbi:MAG: isoprenyl transferase [Chitinophagales bacterium]|nr:isoprenyl transferase [Chitinophagales bacterium]MDW8418326.1 isoprenyl transferase [Chitinophagales bacterium]
MSYKDKIDLTRLPRHIAVIMDGNGRWAKARGKNRIFGHTNGVRAVRETAEACAELGVEYLTVYAFSTENWSRPEREVNALMSLLVKTIDKEIDTLLKNDIRLGMIGDMSALPKSVADKLRHAIETTAHCKRMQLTLALSYSGKAELERAIKLIAKDVLNGSLIPEDITQELIEQYLYTYGMPDPELLIRTSGEQRLSNFLLWQMAYAEFYFTDVMWPDFDREELYKAVYDFQHRERRFGKTSEQLAVS